MPSYVRIALLSLTLVVPAAAQDIGKTPCPPPQPGQPPQCKVLLISPQEEQALAGPNMILDVAEWGRRVDLSQAVQYFKQRLRDAPQGQPYQVAPAEKPTTPENP